MKNTNNSTFNLLMILIAMIFNITIIYYNCQVTKSFQQILNDRVHYLEELGLLRIEDGTYFVKTNNGDYKLANLQEFNLSYKGNAELEKEGKLVVIVSIKNGEAILKDYAVSEIRNGYPFAEFKNDNFNNLHYIPYLSKRALSVW